MPVLRGLGQPVLEDDVDGGAEERTQERAGSAQHGHEHHLRADGQVQDRRRDQPLEGREERAGHGRERRRQGEGDQLGAERVVAEEGGPLVVLPHEDDGGPERRPREAPGRPEAEEHDGRFEQEEVPRLAQLERHEPRDGHAPGSDDEPVVATGHGAPLEGHREEELAEGQRQEGEVRAAQAHAEQSDDQPRRPPDQRGQSERHQEGERRLVLEQQAERVATHAERRRVAEREQPGVAEQQVEGHGEEAEIEDLDDHPQAHGIEHPRERVQRHDGHRPEHAGAGHLAARGVHA